MNFGEALTLIKVGKRVARADWPKGRWIRCMIPYLDAEFSVRENNSQTLGYDSGTLMNYIGIHTSFGDNKFGGLFEPWVPSHTDLFAEDWAVIQDEVK